MYLLFFLLRDGAALARDIRAAIPLEPEHKARLFEQLHDRDPRHRQGQHARRRGAGRARRPGLLVPRRPRARCCGAVLMAFLSLLPAVGAALVWVPVALYLLVTGAVWQGIGLIAFGVVVIGLVDNVLRPILVGKDTRMPDYVVLISTLGGMALFGLNGFVIGPVIAAMFIVGLADPRARARRRRRRRPRRLSRLPVLPQVGALLPRARPCFPASACARAALARWSATCLARFRWKTMPTTASASSRLAWSPTASC